MFQKKNLFVLMLLALLSLLTACTSGGKREPTPTPLPPISSYEKTVFTVERGSIVAERSAMAEVVPSRQDELFFRASGFVTRVAVKEGDLVKAGDLLAELQVDDLLNQLEQATIDLEVAQSNLARYQTSRKYSISRAEIDLSMWQTRLELAKLDAKEAATNDQRVRAELNLQLTQANLDQAQLALDQAREDISSYEEQAVQRSQLAVDRLQALITERQIVAPYDCVILKNRLRAGSSIEAYQSSLLVGDPTKLVVRMTMDRDLRNILTKESEVRLYLSTEAEESFPVAYLPNFLPITAKEGDTQAITTDYLYYSLPDELQPNKDLMGHSVKLIVVLGRKDDVLMLPPAAIRNYRGLDFVIVIEGDTRRRVEIYEIGLKTTDRWEIVSDLKEGDQVLGP